MKIRTHFVTDANGGVLAVQIPIEDWKALVKKLGHYEQLLKLQRSLGTALNQVERMRAGKLQKRTLRDLLPVATP